MNQVLNLILGGVYQTKWDERPFRVLAFDDIELFYDCYWPSLDKWTFGNLKSKGYYYRMTPSRFLDSAQLLSKQPLTQKELETFRPDLPLRVCRNKNIAWTDQQYPDIENYKRVIINSGVDISDTVVLPVNEIVLHPFGPKRGSVKPTTIASLSQNGFTETELLWNAQNIQSIHLREKQRNGVGIFRLGHEKKKPAYYIGGYNDKANSIEVEV
jgi:hypothetical protein